jgi:hypothetical protein
MKASLVASSTTFAFALSLLLFIAPGTSRAQDLFVADEGNSTVDVVNSSADLAVYASPFLMLGMAWLATELLALLRMGRPLPQVSVSKPLTACAKADQEVYEVWSATGGHGWWSENYALDALPQLRHADDKRSVRCPGSR